ncbi:MAG: 3-hydroxylacyl-ACP dehydratase [Treponema sp.]|nr:3-hydroxylacyl-ACP dehydratase [Treponema sp.]
MSVIEGKTLENLVPHRGKMLWLSRIISCDLERHSLVAEYDITRQSLFFDSWYGGFPAWASFELMAQGISALSGMYARRRNQTPRCGFILSVSGMEAADGALEEGAVARVEVNEETVVNNVFSFRCRVGRNEETVARAVLTVAETDDIEALIKQREPHGQS